MTNQLIFKSGCWTCQGAREDPQKEHTCPSWKIHWEEFDNYEYF